jgi:hypothetical protein
MDWKAENLVFDLWQSQQAFLFSIASRPALEPTQPPVQWVPGALHSLLKRQGREADRSSLSSAEVKNGRATPPLYHAPSWRGA